MNREKKGIITGIIGTISNLLLAITKLIVGLLSGSIAIQTDAINNFGDAISTIAVSFSFIFSKKKADKDHPFGHGRIEYVVSFAMAILIIIVAIEFLINSIQRILNPQGITFSWLFFILIAIGIFIKLVMAVFYHITNKTILSPSLVAAKIDSIQDVIISSATLFSLGMSKITTLPLDGIIGGAISLLLIVNGIKLIRTTMDDILGKQDKALSSKIMALVMNQKNILGAHDLLLHDYGPNRSIASVHAEIPSHMTLTDAHRIIDDIEKLVMNECAVDLVVHIDPVDIDDDESKHFKNEIRKKLQEINPLLTFHDFRLDKKLEKLFIDLVIPFDLKIDENIIISLLETIDFNGYCLECIVDYQ